MKEEVVISGISGRFPECDNLEELWESLVNRVDLVTEDDRRWPIGIHGIPNRKGTLKSDLDKFDANFFNINRKQAEKLDPQVCKLLEVTYEAVLDAGVNPKTIRGNNIGVYVGSTTHDLNEFTRLNSHAITPFDLLGSAGCMLANRISYTMDFKGPSFTIDTYCSSSMIALHQAATAIRNGEIDAAIVCGVNLLLNPLVSKQIQAMGALSMGGKCKSFDAAGDGYVRSEAVVAVFLQNKNVARRSYGEILHSKASADGYKLKGISNPSGEAQENLMRATYKEAGIDPGIVNYVEAHGTGTAAGDPEELNAIANVFLEKRKSLAPLLVGSTKSNLGHSEPASSLCALSKLVLSLRKGVLPPNLHFSNPNPAIPALLNGELKVVTECTKIDGTVFGLNASGIGGANAHIILQSQVKPQSDSDQINSSLPVLIPFSGRTKEGVEMGLQNVIAAESNGAIRLLQKIHEDDIPGFEYRGCAILGSSNLAISNIEAEIVEPASRPLWFIFSGMGSQWTGMAKQMMQFPAYRASIEASAEILSKFNVDLIDILVKRPETLMSNNSGVSYMAAAIALVDLLSSIGLSPDGMIGHSVGELICAYADGCLTRREALIINMNKDKSVCTIKGGAMAAVGMNWEEACNSCPEGVYAVCHNGSNNCTVAGSEENVRKFVEELKAKGTFSREVDSGGVAFHSPLLLPAFPSYETELRKFLSRAPKRSRKWISTSVPESRWHEEFAQTVSVEYILNNFISPVLFYEALSHIPANAVVVEVSSSALFQSILKKDLPTTCATMGLMKRDADDNQLRFIKAIGALFQLGFNPKISALYPEMRFPVPISSPMIAPLVKWNYEDTYPLPDFCGKGSTQTSSQLIEIILSNPDDAFLEGHRIDGRTIFPAAGYLVLAWKALANLNNLDFQQMPVLFQNVKFERATILQNALTSVQLKLNILELTGLFEIVEGTSIVATGRIFKSERLPSKVEQYDSELKKSGVQTEMLCDDLYKWFRLRGYEYDGVFKGIASAELDGRICKLRWLQNWTAFLDTVLQTKLVCSNPKSLALPTGINALTIDPITFSDYILNNSDSVDALPVMSSSIHKVTYAPGLEVQGINFTETSRREKVQSTPVLEEYRFVPYLDSPEVFWDEQTALKICVDIVVENIHSKSISVYEFNKLNSDDSVGHMAQKINTFAGRKVDLCNLSESEVDLTNATSSLSKNADLIIIQENSELISKCGFLIQPRGFILFITANSKPGDLITKINSSCWNPIPMVYKKTLEHHFYLFRMNRLDCLEDIHVSIDNDFKWISTLQKIMTNDVGPTTDIVLHSTIQNSGIIGLVNCLRLEPGGSRMCCSLSPGSSKMRYNDLVFNVINDRGENGSYRHLRKPGLEDSVTACKNYRLKILSRKNLSTLRWIKIPPMAKHDSVYQVYCASLNFRDIMMATGQLSPDVLPNMRGREDMVLGVEFVGKNYKGERVMGIVECGALATQLQAENGLIWRVPKYWTMEEAATVPVAFTTAYLALVMRGRIQRGESILIQQGSSMVGQAAISIALSMGCEVYVTAGTENKKKFLLNKFPQLKEKNFANSRTTDFKQHFLHETQGRGMNLILNSLAEEKLQASLDLLSTNGRFLEIGKFDLSKGSALNMAVFLRNTTFHGILLESSIGPEIGPELLRLVQEGIDSGVVRPLVRRVYSPDQVEDAFRQLLDGTNIGKAIIKLADEAESGDESPPTLSVAPMTYFNPDRVYIIVGGLGGVGLEMADWFVSRGARKLALVSRTGITNGFQSLKAYQWRRAGVQVLICLHDLTTISGTEGLVKECMEIGSIGGIFNLAMVLRDGIFVNQTAEDFEATCKPKLTITENLDTVSRKLCPDLEYFVAFSSVSCGRGNAGQSNYGMANSCMERICESRRKDALPALAIQWGAIAEAGVVHEKMNEKSNLVGGTVPQYLASFLNVLDRFLCFQDELSPVLSSAVLPEITCGNEKVKKNKMLHEDISHILGLKNTAKISDQATLGDLGADSLVSVEIQNVIQARANIDFTTNEVRLLTWGKVKAIQPENQN